MESIIQADIFFFVTTVVVLVIGILLSILLVFAIKLIRDIYIIMEVVREEAVHVLDDIDEFRRNVKHKAERLSGLLGIVTTARFIRRVLKPKKQDTDE
jgi:hypothetical protein